MYAYVVFQNPDGRTARLGHGEFIGRLWSAALCLDDPRVSEAHAMVSLRLGELRLLALRGRFTVGRKRLADLRLTAGLEIQLTGDTTLTVTEVVLPRQLLTIEGDGLAAQVLPGSCGLVLEPEPALVSPVPEDAWMAFWNNGSGWRCRRRGEPTRALLAGDEWTVDERSFRAALMDTGGAGDGVTLMDVGLELPLRIVAHYDTVHIHRGHGEPAVLSGIGARLLSELAMVGGPIDWRILARELWGDLEPVSLRRRLDVCAHRLRSRLRETGIRPDLVRATGTGHYELFLHERDRVEDRA